VTEHVVNAGGLWAREVGRMVGLELPVLAMEHMYLITEDMRRLRRGTPRPDRDHHASIHASCTCARARRHVDGSYEKANKVWSEFQTPWNFGHELLSGHRPHRAVARSRLPAFPGLRERPASSRYQWAFTFAPDGNPVVGPVRGLPGFWVAWALWGLHPGRRRGLALSNWMIEGDPGADIWAMDVARYGDWATMAYTNAKVREKYSRRFSIRFPNEELPAGRTAEDDARSMTFCRPRARNGVCPFGLEVPLWYAPEGVKDEFSWRRSSDFTQCRERGLQPCAMASAWQRFRTSPNTT